MTKELWGVPAGQLQDIAAAAYRLAHRLEVTVDGTPEPSTPGEDLDFLMGLRAEAAGLRQLAGLIERGLGG